MKRRNTARRPRTAVFGALLLALCMLFTGSLSVYAGENEKNAFLSLVGEIDPEGSYAARSETIADAVEAYGKLTNEEKSDAQVISAKNALDAETEAVGALKETAESFLFAVAAVADAADIMAKIAKIGEAEEYYFDDESYPGITAALAAYTALKTTLDATEETCLSFIQYVEAAKRDLDEEAGYRTVKASFDLAVPLFDLADSEYDRVANMKEVYKWIASALLKTEENNDAFLRQVTALKASTSYRDINKNLGFCEQTLKIVEDEDYDGIEEGKQAMEDARILLAEKTLQATVFSQAVYNVIHAENFAARVSAMDNARAERENTDLTVPEADSADAELRAFEQSYADTVAYENAAMDAFLLSVFAFGRS